MSEGFCVGFYVWVIGMYINIFVSVCMSVIIHIIYICKCMYECYDPHILYVGRDIRFIMESL